MSDGFTPFVRCFQHNERKSDLSQQRIFLNARATANAHPRAHTEICDLRSTRGTRTRGTRPRVFAFRMFSVDVLGCHTPS